MVLRLSFKLTNYLKTISTILPSNLDISSLVLDTCHKSPHSWKNLLSSISSSLSVKYRMLPNYYKIQNILWLKKRSKMNKIQCQFWLIYFLTIQCRIYTLLSVIPQYLVNMLTQFQCLNSYKRNSSLTLIHAQSQAGFVLKPL